MNKEQYEDIVRRSIKVVDIGYSAAAYFTFALLVVIILNKLSGPYDQKVEDEKSTIRLIIDIIFRMWLIGVLAYIARNLFHAIPFPFNGMYGYKHLHLKEVQESTIFVAFVVIFDVHLQSQVITLKKRLGININGSIDWT